MSVAKESSHQITNQSKQTPAGILPNVATSISEDPQQTHIATSIFGISQEYFDYVLPGHGSEPYDDCGDWRKGKILVCPDYQKHLLDPQRNQTKLLTLEKSDIEVEWHKRNCRRPGCPVCYEKWAAAEASKIEHRLKYVQGFLSNRRKYDIIHVVISPPEKVYLNSSPEQLKKNALKVAKSRGLFGGIPIFHPWRRVCARCGCHPVETSEHFCPDCGSEFFKWYVSPHYHILGFGWIKNTAELYQKDGWFVKKISDGDHERDIFKTALYQLSHCGISPTLKRVAVGFGVCSSAGKKAVIVPPKPKEKHVCTFPGCQKELVPARFVGTLEQLENLHLDELYQQYRELKTRDPFLVRLDPSLLQIKEQKVYPKHQKIQGRNVK